MKVLVGCETSGVLRNEFLALGHNAWSCDLLPADDGSNRHMVCDIRDILNDGWDMLAVMHPPCTRLCNSGVRWLTAPPKDKTLDEMWADLDAGAALFSACWNAPIERVVVENPVMHKHAKSRIINYAPPTQIVQPWWFGDKAFKATGFYIRGVKPLVATDRLEPPKPGTQEHKEWSAVHRATPGPDRWKIRSKTFPGIAKAIAAQMGGDARQQCEVAA